MGKPGAKALGKRKAPASKPPAPKKAKAASTEDNTQANGRPKRKPDQPKKVKLRDQKTIPVPKSIYAQGSGDEDDGMDDDMLEDLGEEEGLGLENAKFLAGIDTTALSRSVKETKRLHELAKAREIIPQAKKRKSKTPVRQPGSDESDGFDSDPEFDSDLQSDMGSDVDFGSEDGGSLASDDEDDFSGSEDGEDITSAFDNFSSDEDEDEPERRKRKKKEEEAEYELAGRSRWVAKPEEPEEDSVEVGRLPIKLPTGEIQMVQGSTRIAVPQPKKPVVESGSEDEEEDDVEEEEENSDDEAQAKKMASQKGKFGKMGIAEIVGKKGWKNVERLEAAKEQVAQLGSEILAGGELVDIGPVLIRLSSFGLPTVPALEEGQPPLSVPASIRGLVFLSQLTVYKDLIPGYRIRELTALEEAEKVRDEVKRLREGEKMLVRSYKGYLKMLEAEIKVFREDVSGQHSQTLVRLIARMIKERHFQVHPNVLFCLLHLRLKDELDQMRRGKNAKGGNKGKGEKDEIKGKKFKSEKRKKWATKNQKKREKEMKEVQKEMAEAEAEVDKEERAQVQTETLKNLFVLYFSVLKNPKRTPLLPAALEGISTYSHFINIDFFRDLLVVLRKIIADQQLSDASNKQEEESEDESAQQLDVVGTSQRIRNRLLAIATAFDLLSGQGEALNIDLSDFINQLFALLRPLCLDTGIEDPPFLPASTKSSSGAVHTLSTSALLFRCLNASFFSRYSRSPANRSAAFAKRLTECALHFPPRTGKQAIAFARSLVSKEPKIEGLLDTEERMADGAYRPELDDPQLVNPFTTSWWEAGVLGSKHWDREVRLEMSKLRDGKVV
ncbi:nucleolar complex protein 3 [Cryptococcus deuterogattii LA55]|nr:nucleolar complex protein 3 [Cryptococcus deuterogattii LA55]KIR71732.1 nucleolar complex protein 3 [Cryptococcus deuterogattii CA1014]KIR91315.1 nucleolar complex protein 3 [Cryptococcus deuterogattii CBS 10090]